MQKKIISSVTDINDSIKKYSLISILGWQDVKQRYRRSTLGPFWLTISMGVMISTIGLVFGQLFDAPMKQYLPFFAIGMILWSFYSTTLNEGCIGFVCSEAIIKQLPIPLFSHILRVVWRNTIIFAHNLVILPIIFIIFGITLDFIALLSILGIILAIINLAWMALLGGILCTRYRDLPQIVLSILQVLYFITPIIWMPNQLPKQSTLYLLDLNPAYHLIEVVRAPLLGLTPSFTNWCVSIGLMIMGWLITIITFGCYKNRISYWL